MKHTVLTWSFAILIVIAPVPYDAHAHTELSAIKARGDLKRMEEIASTGDVRAEAWMGLMLQNRGRREESKVWWRKAAAQNDPWAISMLGRMLLRDSQDEEAAHWYRRGAVAGSASAQQAYASLLLAGRGVARNENEAVRWLEAAADQHSAYAYIPLAELYEAGRGTDRDPIEAYALATIAEVALDDSESGSATGMQDRLEKGLSSDEVAIALQRVRARYPQYDERVAAQTRRSLFLLMPPFALLAVLAGILFAINQVIRGIYRFVFGRAPNLDLS